MTVSLASREINVFEPDCDIWGEREDCQASEAGEGTVETQQRASGVVKDYTASLGLEFGTFITARLTFLPGWHGLETIQQTAVVAQRGGPEKE